jgi:hypothetical protein
MCLCGEGHIGLRRWNWRADFLLILEVQPVRLPQDTGRKGTVSLYVVDSREEPVPSFMLMDLQGMSLVLYIYTLENGQIKVEKVFISGTVLTIAIISERGVIVV